MVAHKTWLLINASSTAASSVSSSGIAIHGAPGKIKYCCPYCSMSFTRNYDKNRHISQKHIVREEDFIRCILCPNVKIHVKQKSNLKLHLKTQHYEWLQEFKITADCGVELCRAKTGEDRPTQDMRPGELPIFQEGIHTTARQPKLRRAKRHTGSISSASECSSSGSGLHTADEGAGSRNMREDMRNLHLHDGTTVSVAPPVSTSSTQDQSSQSDKRTTPSISLPPMHTWIRGLVDKAHLKNSNRTDDDDFICLWREKGDLDPCLDRLEGTEALIRHCEESHELSTAWVSYHTNEPFVRCQWDKCRAPPMLRGDLSRHVKELHSGKIEHDHGPDSL